jgi:3'-5' exonuclease
MEEILKKLRNILFLDIETASQMTDYQQLSDRIKALWDKKVMYLRNDDELSNQEMYFKKAAIYAEFGKVICIGFGGIYFDENEQMCFRVKTIYGHDEAEILQQFKQILEKHKAGNTLMLAAHNGKEFDFPYICRRMLLNNITLPRPLQLSGKKPWEIPHIDTMEMWKFGDGKQFSSLELLAAIFDVPSSKTEMDGSEVNVAYHHNNELEKIQRYCKQDVIVLAQLYLKLNSLDMIKEDNIQFV